MNIREFTSQYKNHPVLFIGTGISLRYHENSFTWDGLLSKIAYELKNDHEYYLDLKASCEEGGKYRLDKVAGLLERDFNAQVASDRHGKFKEINDVFYENMSKNHNISRFKIYVAKLLSTLNIKSELANEIAELKKTRKNIGSIITSNYDCFVERIFDFNKLIGNDILLSNPYGSVYKIHGCCSMPDKIILTDSDYSVFDDKYELIRAQLLSLFIHNPIIFLGYGVGDENIKKILKTIFTYVEPNSELAYKIRNNFLLVEYEQGNMNEDISEHDIDMDGFSTIRINKIKTDNFLLIYQALSEIHLPISAMDVRKVQSVVKEIYSGGDIKVSITEDLDTLKNGDRILAIGSSKTISYHYQTSSEMMANYFKIIDESNSQILTLIDKYTIQSAQYFPICGFGCINSNLSSIEKLKALQVKNLNNALNSIHEGAKRKHVSIEAINADNGIPVSYKSNAILWNAMHGNIALEEIEKYLRECEDKQTTSYRRILCAYDLMKYENVLKTIQSQVQDELSQETLQEM